MPETRLTCPSCSEQQELRKSHTRPIDYFALFFRRYPYRCLMCNRRFYSGLQPASERSSSHPRAGTLSKSGDPSRHPIE